MDDDNQNGRPQFVNVQILFVVSKHDECKRPQLYIHTSGNEADAIERASCLILRIGLGKTSLRGVFACFAALEKPWFSAAYGLPFSVPTRQ